MISSVAIRCVDYTSGLLVKVLKVLRIVKKLGGNNQKIRRIKRSFSKIRHLKLREKLRPVRKTTMQRIEENGVREFLATIPKSESKLKLSASDHFLNCLQKGWTIKETLGLVPCRKYNSRLSTHEFMEQLFWTPCRYKQKRRFDFTSLWTEFLSDLIINNYITKNTIKM